MNKTKWIGVAAVAATIVAALGTGLWFGGGPTSREGWEAASWAAGITTALALIGTTITWSTTSQSSTPALPPDSTDGSDVVNTVNGNISGGTVIQGQDTHMENTTYGGDHLDFGNSTFDGTVIGKQVNHHPEPSNDRQEPGR